MSLSEKVLFFAVSVLSKNTPLEFIGHFGFKCGRDTKKLKGMDQKVGRTGVSIVLNHAIAYLEAKVIKEVDGGTHTIFIGKMVEAKILRKKNRSSSGKMER